MQGGTRRRIRKEGGGEKKSEGFPISRGGNIRLKQQRGKSMNKKKERMKMGRRSNNCGLFKFFQHRPSRACLYGWLAGWNMFMAWNKKKGKLN